MRISGTRERSGSVLALDPLFAPVRMGALSLPTALAMAPMTRFRSPGGIPTARNATYYARRAAAGIGLVLTEGVYVDHASAGHDRTVPRLADDTASGWRRVIDAVHAEGAAVVPQLWHLGSSREPVDAVPAWTPSGVQEPGRPPVRAMTLADIDAVVAAFAASARVAQRSGADGVEVHGAHGYLVDEFWWPATNRRTDGYGGGPRERARFAAEIVAAIRDATGPDFPVIVRFSQHKDRAYGARIADTPAELAAALAPVVDAGATALHASQRRFWEPAFAGSALNLAGWAKVLTGLPTITVGSVGLTRDAIRARGPAGLEALAARRAAGEFDVVAVGRALLANPQWARHVRAGDVDAIVDYEPAHKDRYP